MRTWVMNATVAVLMSLFCTAGMSEAGVNVNVNIGLPPPVVIAAPPALVVVPGSYVYFAPDIEIDLIFFQGFWYRPYSGHWYRSDDYNKGWVVVNVVPQPILSLPPRWKQVPPGHARMPYREVRDNWQTWERDKHWEKEAQKRRERSNDRSDDDQGRKGKKEKKGKRRNGGNDDRHEKRDRGR